MGRYKNLLSILTLTVMVMGLTVVASAQWRNGRSNSGYYGNANLNSTIKNLRDNARRFEDALDRELDRSRYDGTQREDSLNRLAERFKNAAEKLEDEYEYRDMRDSNDEARRVISIGQQLGNALRRSRANRNSTIRGYWSTIQRDLRIISQAYNTGYNDQYGRNDRNNRNNDRYGRNRGNNNGRYGQNNGRYTRNLRATIVNLRNKSRRLENQIDRIDNNDRYGNRRSRNNLENLSDRFDDAVKDLEKEYDNRRDYNDSYNEVRRVLSVGEQLDREISRNRVNRNLRSEWNSIERDLQTIARAYNLSYNGSNNRNIRDIIRNFPF
jgi:hypothetical protein